MMPPMLETYLISSRFGFGNALRGSQGIQGTTGTQGDLGIQGIQGLNGEYAAQGIQGPQGTLGVQGTSGRGVTIPGSVNTDDDLQGYPDSYSGNVGDGYITLDNGHLNTWSGSAWDDVGNITGPQGTTGHKELGVSREPLVFKD